MSWTRHDWIDLFLMVLGAIVGVAICAFGIAPALGIEFSGGKPTSYMLASAVGVAGGYLLRIVARATFLSNAKDTESS